MGFITEDFMLQSETAKRLYAFAKDEPIYDFHCHLEPQAIYEDEVYDNIVDLWLAGDHYKWRLMRGYGVSEHYITGDASNEDKFRVWAESIETAFGNALYHWTHLEMAQVFGITDLLTKDNWREIYDSMNAYIQEHQVSPRQLLNFHDVKFVGTTDHPLDTLEWHQKIAADETIDVVVAPTFRPDEAFVDHVNFPTFVTQLAKTVGRDITDYESFMVALEERVEYFVDHGCRATDISFGAVLYEVATDAELNDIFTKAMQREALSKREREQWQTMVFEDLNVIYQQHDLISQVHFGALRNNNTTYAEQLGPDAGFDSMGDQAGLAVAMNQVMDALVRQDALPKMIWYNLNPAYNTVVANTASNFQANEAGIKSQIQFGAGWWFNDTKLGMLEQMQTLADQGILANFVGMLTDSRSFLSFQRHDYFRRILVNMVAEWVDQGEIPADDARLKPFIQDICYNNAEAFFKAVE